MKAVIPKSLRRVPKRKKTGLREKPEQATAWDRLPFVGRDHSKTHSSWDVPMTGGYFGGIAVGEVVFRMYLKYVRDEQGNHIALCGTHLTGMLHSLENRNPVTSEEIDSVRGQKVGFFGALSTWLEAAACKLGSSLDAIPHRSFVQSANEALQRDDASFMAAIEAAGRKKKVESAQ
ncbi:hypothetical protein ALQ72_01112 [Pseudomonas syringae pv. maculicola]|uniref:hypothetical protein n=1 Tax=Pseudomonas syringae group genomosp. 3 TaxID=251701 RepID=UPI0006B977B2|nr:hypothetical protein [Pseudomonas syringae group genomosp. 3]KPB92854.1 Uncharacterized protein AC503_3724 [Pseudomonas syringae pv. maculicola]MBM0211849.1 hypothetical protein [Pseudomonas syringae pv. maculicola]RMM83746.1 hypothetical protein ALQ72_01112 [Pseudomonas syringae pv. maculicola]